MTLCKRRGKSWIELAPRAIEFVGNRDLRTEISNQNWPLNRTYVLPFIFPIALFFLFSTNFLASSTLKTHMFIVKLKIRGKKGSPLKHYIEWSVLLNFFLIIYMGFTSTIFLFSTYFYL